MTIELKDVVFEYRGRGGSSARIFDGLNFRIEKGERVGIIGDEGAGKTTLLQLMAGLLIPSSGKVVWDDEKVEHIRKHCGFAFQFPEQQFICETVAEEIQMTSRVLKLPPVEPMPVLARFGFGDEQILERSPYSLSLGEARRVAIASIMASYPSVLFLDEPTVGLDMAGTRQILDVLKRLNNVTLVIASHDMNFLSEIVDRVIVLRRGSVVVDSSAEFFCDVERMHTLGFEAPEVVQCVHEARRRGMNVAEGIRTRSDFFSAMEGLRQN